MINYNVIIDIKNCSIVNYLWVDLLNRLGFEKANQAISQAFDLNLMTGHQDTLPVLFIETCGIALIDFKTLEKQPELKLDDSNKVILYCPKNKEIQLLK